MKKKVLYCILFLSGGIMGAMWMAHLCQKALVREDKYSKRYIQNFNLSCNWIRMLQEGKDIKDYFEKYPTHSLAIYGMGELGKCLKNVLQKSGITVNYVIDMNKQKWSADISSFDMQDELPDVEKIIVTPIWDFDVIKEELEKKLNTEVISLKTVIDEIRKEDYRYRI